MPSVNISQPVLIFDEWICQRWRQLQTFESLNRGNCLTGFQQTSVARGKARASRKLAGSSRVREEEGEKMAGARCAYGIWSSCGHPNLEGRSTADTIFSDRQLRVEFNFLFKTQIQPLKADHLPWGFSSSSLNTDMNNQLVVWYSSRGAVRQHVSFCVWDCQVTMCGLI